MRGPQIPPATGVHPKYALILRLVCGLRHMPFFSCLIRISPRVRKPTTEGKLRGCFLVLPSDAARLPLAVMSASWRLLFSACTHDPNLDVPLTEAEAAIEAAGYALIPPPNFRDLAEISAGEAGEALEVLSLATRLMYVVLGFRLTLQPSAAAYRPGSS